MMPSTYSFIVPAYNESERLAFSLPKILDYVRQQELPSEIIVVNDGSTDNTAEVVRRFMAVNPDVRLVENPGNRGKGYSVRNGMLHATGDVMLFTDADLSSPIHEADKLFAAIRQGADVAIGSRWLQRELQTDEQGAFTVALPWRGTYVIEIEHVDTKAGGEGAGAYDRKRFVTSLSFKVARGLEGPPAPPITVPKRAMTE